MKFRGLFKWLYFFLKIGEYVIKMLGIYAICFGFIIDISSVNGDITEWPPFLGDEQDCPTWTDSYINSPQVCLN